MSLTSGDMKGSNRESDRGLCLPVGTWWDRSGMVPLGRVPPSQRGTRDQNMKPISVLASPDGTAGGCLNIRLLCHFGQQFRCGLNSTAGI